MKREKDSFCTFLLGGLLLGVPVAKVQEVLRHQEVTPVPHAPAIVRGLMNLRGQIIAAIDLRRRLALPDLEGREPMIVVVRATDGATALLVDEIGDVVETDDEIERPPETLPQKIRALTMGVHKLQAGLLLVLAADLAVSVERS